MRRVLPLVLAVASAPTAARADESAPPASSALHWDEEKPRFRPWEYALTLAVGIAAIAEYTWVPPQREPHWVGGILFDDAVRDALRLRSPSAQRMAWTLADAVGTLGPVLVVGLDSFLVPTVRGSFDTAWQLTWIDFESYALGSVATFTLYDTVGRARPSYEDCRSDPSYPGCTISPTASFPSGHTAEAFISAGLSCANHAFVPIYGRPWFDALACARDTTLAVADGVLRIMGDRHYATDVLAGGLLGFGFGYGLPVLLHYGPRLTRDSAIGLAPMLGPAHGLVATGAF